ncbi:MAG: DNA recombination protein RmuC [Candidatus Pacebacteria bacterium]|jgi:DNA recombination protein RmuC|nr:DNA recombination protein RmuC [Candidatus Paceibacterota bacterium]
MDTMTLILFIVVLLGLGIQTWLILRKKEERPADNGAALNMLQQQLNQVSTTLDSKLTESNRAMQQQFGQSFAVIKDVTQKLTELDNTNKQVMGFAEQLQSLENILKNPKQRGILGEYYLETVLKNVLPPQQFAMQYKFKNGEIVDAVVFVKDKIIPIDSKFSLENYNRIVNEKDETNKIALEKLFKADLKLRIDETSKYIRPNENTMEFALMFIPSEGIYYDLLINEVGSVKVNTRDLIEYAFQEKHVIIVSPTNFLAYLQTVLQGLRALQIEESAKEIRQRVEMLGKHLCAYDEYLQKLGGHLATSVNTYNAAYKEFGKIDKDVLKITDVDRDRMEIKQIDKPSVE